jgi:hypothetical protein
MKLFISYSRDEKPLCKAIAERLRAFHEVWIDEELLTGTAWQEMLDEKVAWADGFIYLLSPSSVKSKHCKSEFQYAKRLNKLIFPVIIERDTKLPKTLASIQVLDLSNGIEDLDKLLNALTKAIEKKLADLSQTATAPDSAGVGGGSSNTSSASNPQVTSNSINSGEKSGCMAHVRDNFWQAFFGVLFTIVIGGIFGVALDRCNSFPIAFQQIRDLSCTPPNPYPPQSFVIVSSKLLGTDGLDSRMIRAISQGIEAELATSDLSATLGTPVIIHSSDAWIDAATSPSQMPELARHQAQLFNADLVIYGQLKQDDFLFFEPAFYLSQTGQEDLLILMDSIDPENLGIQIPIIEGSSYELSDWVQATWAFALGLQHLRMNTNTQESRIGNLESALTLFSAVPESVDDEFYAIANLYAGNAALELALLKQADYENSFETTNQASDATVETDGSFQNSCINGRCLAYDATIIETYLRAWNHYTLAMQSGRGDISIRGLIGLGNVHYRLARISRYSPDDDSDERISYDCFSGSSLLSLDISQDTNFLSEINWAQRAIAATICYEDVLGRAENGSLIEIKAIFGLAQSYEWLGRERHNEAYLADSFEQYSEIIRQYESLAHVEQLDSDLRCFAGFAYGQRAQIRWVSQDETFNGLTEVREDLVQAVAILEVDAAKCDASESIEQYSNDLDTLSN